MMCLQAVFKLSVLRLRFDTSAGLSAAGNKKPEDVQRASHDICTVARNCVVYPCEPHGILEEFPLSSLIKVDCTSREQQSRELRQAAGVGLMWNQWCSLVLHFACVCFWPFANVSTSKPPRRHPT